MRLSEDKINHLSHLIAYALDDAEDVRFKTDLNKIRIRIKELITAELQLEDNIDLAVRDRLKKRKRLLEGSDEWRVLYEKEFQEEMKRRVGKFER